MRNSPLLVAITILGTAGLGHAALIITGVVDGPRSGGVPKAIELFATTNIPDLSIYNVETPNNGATPVGSEFALSGSASAGQFLYVASESPEFTTYFGFAPTFADGVANINGDDNIILYESGSIVDEFGDVGVDGTGTAWEYMDGFAYRNDGTGPDTVFVLANWTFSGIDFLDSQGTSGVNGGDGKTVPFGTYKVPEPASLGLIGLGALTLLRRRTERSAP